MPELDRFRSFLERYIIARAPNFTVGKEQEDAWAAIQDAKKVYGMVAQAKNETDPSPARDPAMAGQTANRYPVAQAGGSTPGGKPWVPRPEPGVMVEIVQPDAPSNILTRAFRALQAKQDKGVF